MEERKEERLALMQAPNWTRKHMHVVDHTLNECEVSLAQDLIAGIEHACFFFHGKERRKVTHDSRAASSFEDYL